MILVHLNSSKDPEDGKRSQGGLGPPNNDTKFTQGF